MQKWIVAVFLGVSLLVIFVTVGLSSGQNTTETSTARKIVVRFLNGKTGKPIRDDAPNIWLDDADHPMNPHTDSHGEVTVDVPNPRPLVIRALPNMYADCRSKGDSTGGSELKYSIEEIMTHGMAGQNFCGKYQIPLSPGVLVLYVRPRTLLEKWRL